MSAKTVDFPDILLFKLKDMRKHLNRYFFYLTYTLYRKFEKELQIDSGFRNCLTKYTEFQRKY